MKKYIFLGKDSLGYKNNRIYDLDFSKTAKGYEDCKVTICREDGTGLCPYSTKAKFLENWAKVEIMKLQVSLFTNEDAPQVLIYNKSRKIEYQCPATREIVKEMKGEPKQFFYTHLAGTEIVIDKLAPWQEW